MLELFAYVSVFPQGMLKAGNVFCLPLHVYLAQRCLQNRHSVKIMVE